MRFSGLMNRNEVYLCILKFYCLIKNQIQMKKFYSIILVLALGPIIGFGAAPQAQHGQKGTLSTVGSNKASSLQQLNPHLSLNASSVAARHVQPGNVIQALFSDNFELSCDTDSLAARGYHTYYRGGGAQDGPTWFTGNDNVFVAHSGSSASYLGANYAVVTGANDIDSWLVLPSLNLTTADVISFFATSPPGSIYPDSIKVMYSAAGDSVPEAGSWVMVSQFEVSTTGWEQKTFAVPTASATGRWAIRYAVVDGGPNGSNSNYIGIDDLVVGQLPADNVGMLLGYPFPTTPSEYSMIPLSQAVDVQLEGQVENTGSATQTNVGFNAYVYISHDLGASWTAVTNAPSAPQASLPAGTVSNVLSAGPFTFTDTGFYAFQYITYMDNTDMDSTNDIKTTFMFVTDTTYARDYITMGSLASVYGASAFGGNTITFGNIYEIQNPTIISSVTFYHAFAVVGGMIRADIYDVSGGLPNAILASSADYTYTVDDTDPDFLLELTLPLTTPLAVPQGPIFVALTQLDQNDIGVGITGAITTPATAFVQVDTDPFAAVEDFGLSGSWAIRPNITLDDQVSQNKIEGGINVFPNPSNGKLYIHNSGKKDDMTVTVFNNVGQIVYNNAFNQLSTAVIDLTAQAGGVYTVQVKSEKDITTKSVVISNK